jgi:hypothetical protein
LHHRSPTSVGTSKVRLRLLLLLLLLLLLMLMLLLKLQLWLLLKLQMWLLLKLQLWLLLNLMSLLLLLLRLLHDDGSRVRFYSSQCFANPMNVANLIFSEIVIFGYSTSMTTKGGNGLTLRSREFTFSEHFFCHSFMQ